MNLKKNKKKPLLSGSHDPKYGIDLLRKMHFLQFKQKKLLLIIILY